MRQTSFVDAAGDAQACAAIRVGDTVVVDGSIAYSTDRTITGQPLRCGAIQAGDRVEGFGTIAPDASGALEAVRIVLGAPPLRSRP